MQKQHTVALVLVRGGSKGIPLKNLQKIGNRTLLHVSLDVIKEAKTFSSIWVSTDHDLIAQEASKRNSSSKKHLSAFIATIVLDEVNVHIRPKKVSTDNASSLLATREFLEKHKEIDVIALIQCTSPFLRVEYLQQAFSCFRRRDCDCAFAVTRFVIW